MSTYQDRLEAEIDRIGISAVADAIGVARNTIYNWIAKANVPLNNLVALHELGVDVAYVVFDKRSVDSLTKDEQELIALYRSAPLTVKAAAIGALQGGSKPAGAKISIGGSVHGQVIEGNQTNRGTVVLGGKAKITKK